MDALLGPEGVIEDMGGRRERLVDVAAPESRLDREIGRLHILKVLEIGEAAGRPQPVVDVGGGGHRLHLVVDRGKFLVLRHNLVHGRLGDVRIRRHHDRDRLADESYLFEGQNRLVVERRAVIGVGDHPADIVGGVHALHAGNFRGGAGVDRLDSAVRHGAAEDLAVQHAGQPQEMSVFGASGDLFATLEPGQ